MQQDEEHNESEDTNIFNTRLCLSRGTSSLELRQHLDKKLAVATGSVVFAWQVQEKTRIGW